jgi:DNA polymerase III subunit alpha
VFITANGSVDIAEGKEPKVLVDELSIITLEDLPVIDQAETLSYHNSSLSMDEEDQVTGSFGDLSENALDTLSIPHPIEGEIPPPPEFNDWYMHETGNEEVPTTDGGLRKEPEENHASLPASVANDRIQDIKISSVSEVVEEFIHQPPSTPPSILPFSYLIPPMPTHSQVKSKEDELQMVTVVLRSCGDKERDVRRLQRVHGLLHSSPGKDHFSFFVQEKGSFYLIEFPNHFTGVTPELVRKLREMVGEENVQVTPIQIQ